MNRLGKAARPFLFVIDFEQQRPLVIPLDAIDPEHLLYDFPSWSNLAGTPGKLPEPVDFRAFPISLDRYRTAFELVQQHQHFGDSFLLNLTFPTKLATNLTTRQIMQYTTARYRLWWQGQFCCFSPEPFVLIHDGRIYSYPMKGTREADGPEAAQLLLNDAKEKAEHATIVDLIRNDLSQVARKVRVERYRYLEKIKTQGGAIWQSSSEISGELPADYPAQIGDLIFRLLPAGSISGAPKPKTVEVIRAAEGIERGYYTGIAGIFDGSRLESTVLIRFIEEKPEGLYFRSGGGITAQSRLEDEYREMIRKVDLPVGQAPAPDGIIGEMDVWTLGSSDVKTSPINPNFRTSQCPKILTSI